MIIYNVTTKIDDAIKNEWLRWQKEIHIPEIMSTELFYDHRIFKLLEQGEPDGVTFIIQFYSKEKYSCETYINNYSEKFQKINFKKWGDKFVAFQSMLEAVQ